MESSQSKTIYYVEKTKNGGRSERSKELRAKGIHGTFTGS